jgi:hypothetical protein
VRRIRCQYPSGEALAAVLKSGEDKHALEVYTTERFEPGEEVLAEVFFPGMTGKMLIRAIGEKWHTARPRLRVRAGGVLRCAPSEWRKLQFLGEVALGRATMESRRRHVRQPVLVEIRWRRAEASDLAPATISEISEVGALLLTDSPLKTGDELIIEITTPGGARPLELTSVVRNTSHPEGVGVEFMSRNSGGVTRIREVIRRLVDE